MPSRRTNNRRRSGPQQRTAPRPRPQPPAREEAASDGSGAGASPKRPAVQMQLGSSTPAKPRATPPAPGPAPTAARRVQAQRRTAGTRPSRGIQIGDQNPAIPLDKVPYFTSDLIRLAITAAIMIILLIVGAKLVVPHFVG